MNEQQNVNNSPNSKPKKKRSFWWLKLLLILILFAAGVIAGIMLSSEAITAQIMDEFFPRYAVSRVEPSPVATAPVETEAPIEFKPSATPAPKPSKAPVEIISPEAAEKEEAALVAEESAEASPAPTEAVLDFAAVVPSAQPELLPDTPKPGSGYIGIDAALEAALAHAKLTSEEVFVYSVHRERDDGLVYYNVEFGWEGKEYEYEINAYNGDVESWQLDRTDLEDRIAASSGNQLDLSSCISVEQAKAAAFDHAGYKEYETKDLKTSLEIENNKLVYDIEFRAEGYEYDYKVDASSGLVIMLEKERS